MNSFLRLSLIAAITLYSSVYAFAEEATKESRTISVHGEASVKAKPDKATVSFAIISREANAESARKANAETSKKVLNSVRKLGVDEANMRLESLNINEKKEYNGRSKKYELVGFEAVRSFVIELNELDKLAELVATVVQKGSNRLRNVEYGLQDEDSYRIKALRQAVRQAKAKAELLLKPLDEKLGRVQKLNEGYSQRPVMPYRAFSAMSKMADAEPEAYSQGDLDITATVDAIFAIE